MRMNKNDVTARMREDRAVGVANEILTELARAKSIHQDDQHSAHESFAVLYEEVDELWDAVKMRQSDTQRLSLIRKEAVQVGAMVIRMILEVCDKGVIR